MDRLLASAAVGEGVTGLALLVSPAGVVGLLFGGEIAGAGIVMSRIAGIALLGLGVVCWPAADAGRMGNNAYAGMVTYFALAAVYLIYVGLTDQESGPLLWPAALVHVLLTIGLGLAWSVKRSGSRRTDEAARKV